jgi:LuxR family transcriptional regulator, maltose regulon positive regulatory protein
MSNTILKTKFYIPPLRPNLIPRPHLTERLATGVTYPLTLIAAPAGFGKSTLLSEWLSERMNASREDGGTQERMKDEGRRMKEELNNLDSSSFIPHPSSFIPHPSRVAWLSLDKDDNDPVRFLTYFIATLETISPGFSVDALTLLQSPQPPPLQVILPILINNLNSLPHQLVLVAG